MSTQRPTVREGSAADSDATSGFPERFELGDELGRGGMGRVVEARDKLLDRTVALKAALTTDEETLRRFARETQITARLEHPSIVPVYDAGVSPDGSPFYVMRKVTGKPLHELVAASHTLPERLALLPNVLAACQAIAHAHERGIIHRDLKPANILVGARGETIVIDWGLAKARDEEDAPRTAAEPLAADSLRTHAGTVFGTPGFMSPEQSASSNVDARADVYALGATLHFVLTGKVPTESMPGVPRELRAIVDKALARDLDARYRDAGALAEDLARFTTGQLVAAHDYSRGERIARFVRRHRALVVTVAAALAILAIGTWLAVSRVLTARDEALAQARAADRARNAETERASDLVVSQARLLLATNPTAALAMVSPLANTSRWRDVRAVAAGARAAGVAFRLPGPASVGFADLSHAGTRAVVCGVDGSIHVYDLAARTHAIVATLAGRVRAQFVDEQRLVAWADSTITIIDTKTRARATYPHPHMLVRVDARDDAIYFTDAKSRAWRMSASTGAKVELPIPGEPTFLAISPDGKRVAFAGQNVYLIDTKHPELVEKVLDGKTFDLSWSANSERFVAIGSSQVYEVTVHPEIEVKTHAYTNQTAVLARGLVYSSGAVGVTIDDRGAGAADLEGAMAGLHVTAGEFVASSQRNALRIYDGVHSVEMRVPATPISILLASPRSPYIVAICGELVFVWNIEHIMPKRVEVPSYSQIIVNGRRYVWTLSSSGAAIVMDLQSGQQREVPKVPPLRQSSPSSGAFIVARPIAIQETWLLRPDGSRETIDREGTYATSFGERRVLLGTKEHALVNYDIETRTRRTIATFPASIDRIVVRESNPRWAVAVFADGTVSRHDLDTGAASQTRGAARTQLYSPSSGTTSATKQGDVFFAAGTVLRRWRADGALEDFVTLPRAIHTAFLLDDERVLIVVDEGTGYIVDIRTATFVRMPALGASWGMAALDPTLVVSDDRTSGVTVIDVVTNSAWKIARATPAGSTPDITSDGAVVVMRDATLDSRAIALWRLDLPTTPEATARWIDEMTNATFDPRTGMLGWSGP